MFSRASYPTMTISNGHSIPKQPLGLSTHAVHVGSEPDPATGAIIPPISLSTTYQQSAIGIHKGYEYSRSRNPNRDALEALLASLESGGSDSLVFSSGSTATSAVVSSLSFLYPNEPIHILCVNDVYGGTHRYLSRVASMLQGISISSIDLESASPSTLLSALLPTTRLVWIEIPTNPTLCLIDLPLLLSSLPPSILSLVDNTFLSPFYQSPLLHSASLVLHSLTKYINGHSDVLAGALILPPSQPLLLSHLRFLQNAMGTVSSPYDCTLVQCGAKTLALCMKAHGLSALSLASFLSTHPLVSSVSYPGLSTHPLHYRALASLSPHASKWIVSLPPNPHGIPYGRMLSFTLASRAHAEAFLTSTCIFVLAESLGGVESLAEHPAAMTHAGVPDYQHEALGITQGLIRLSVGVEDTDDLIRDVARALDVVARLD